MTVQAGSAELSLALLGASENNLVVVGNSGLYAAVAPSTDLTYQATGDGLKETLSLSSAVAPHSFSFQLSHPGLTLRQDATGQWGFYAPGAGRPSLVLGALNVCDSSKDDDNLPAYCDDARMTVLSGVGQSTVTYTIPSAWLSDPARVFPVTVDPSLFTQGATDTYVSEGYPTTAYGSSTNLLSGNFKNADTCQTLVAFPELPASRPAPVSWRPPSASTST